jgi:hypothetical protein
VGIRRCGAAAEALRRTFNGTTSNVALKPGVFGQPILDPGYGL